MSFIMPEVGLGLAPQERYARIGDSIVLYCKEAVGGFVQADNSSKAYMRVYLDASPLSNPKTGNVKACVFKIVPENKYKANRALDKQLSKMKGVTRESIKLGTSDPVLSRMKKLADAETKDNEAEAVRLHGRPVTYGSIIQLQHEFTGSYLCVNSVMTARTEKAAMRAELCAENSRSCHFRVLPRFKVRTEGDKIIEGDQILLMSLKINNQGLHCSNVPLSDEPHAGSMEVNVSGLPSAFAVYFHCLDSPDESSRIRAGDTICLFHKEIEAYISAEGSFVPMVGVLENAHLRVRKQVASKPKTLEHCTSANVMWQVEDATHAWSGHPLNWEQEIRLRHLPTRQYLAVKPDGNVELAVESSGKNTVFKLISVVKSVGVERESYARIQHVGTGMWLHASTKFIERRSTQLAAKASGVEALVWDKAPLLQLVASKTEYFDDAFVLIKPTDDNVRLMNFAAGMVPVLTTFLKLRDADVKVSAREAADICSSLTELREYMIVEGDAEKLQQKFLRNFGLVDLLLLLVKAPFRDYPGRKGTHLINVADLRVKPLVGYGEVIQQVCKTAYSVITTFLEGESRKNEMYVARNIPFFQTQFGCGLGTAKMLAELYLNNEVIINETSDEQIDRFIKVLHGEKSSHYIDLLRALVECEGHPIPRMQEYICKKLLIDNHNNNRGMLFMTEIDPPGSSAMGMLYINTSGFSDFWLPMDDCGTGCETFFGDAKDEESRNELEQYNYLLSQLKFFGALCKGRNDFCINIIANEYKYVTWRECFFAVRSKALPSRLRAIYCELLINIFVDVGDNRSVLTEPQVNFDWDDVSPVPNSEASADRQQSITGARLRYFPEISDWIKEFLADNSETIAANIGDNKLMASVLKVVYVLVDFGYYSSLDDVCSLLKPLLGVIDGRDDKPSAEDIGEEELKEWRTTQRYKKNMQNKYMCLAKIEAMKVLYILISFRLGQQLEMLLFDYKEATSRKHYTGLTEMKSETWRNNFRYTQEYRDTVRAIIDGKASREEALNFIDLFYSRTRYLEDAVSEEKKQNTTKELMRRGEEPALVEVMLDCAQYDYSQMLNMSMKILHRIWNATEELAETAVKAQIQITAPSKALMKKLQGIVTEMSRIQINNMKSEDEKFLIESLNEVIDFAVLAKDHSNPQPHKVNQAIMCNAGVLTNLLKYTRVVVSEEQVLKNPSITKVMSKVFLALKALARLNPFAQTAINDRLDELIDIHIAENDKAKALEEIFTANKDICMGVQASQINAVVDRIAKTGMKAPAYFNMLQAVAKIEEYDLPIARNQTYIARAVMKYRSEILNAALLGDDGGATQTQKRLKMLMDASDSDGNPVALSPQAQLELEFHVNLVNLLAVCCEGENMFIESICQPILPVNVIMEVLNHDKIGVAQKSPYLRYLVWVFMNTSGGPVIAGVVDLASRAATWHFMSWVERFFVDVCNRLDKFGKNERLPQHVHEYLFLCILPFLRIFYSNYYNETALRKRNALDATNVLEEAIAGTKSLGKVIDRFVTVSSKALKSSPDLIVTIGTSLQPIAVLLELSQGSRDILDASSVGEGVPLLSANMEEYLRFYKEEIDLNDNFNKFAVDLAKTCSGANTVLEQLGSAPTGCEDRVYSEIGGDEELPLSIGFQNLVRSFAEYEMDDGVLKIKKIKDVTKRLIQQPEKFFRYAGLTELEIKEQDARNIRLLQAIRAMIHNEKCQLPSEGDSSAIWRNIKTVQSRLNSLGAVRCVLPLLGAPNPRVGQEALAVIVALLDGHNEDVQKSFVNYFLGTREEMFFIDVAKRMQTAETNARELRSLLQQARRAHEKKAEVLNTVAKTRATGLMSGTVTKGEKLAVVAKSQDETALQQEAGRQMQEEAARIEQDLKFRDTTNVELILRILQLLCEGHLKVLQDYLREQPDNVQSIDLVSQTVTYLLSMYTDVDKDTYGIVVQCLATLVEFCQGNQTNSLAIFDAHILDCVNFYLRQHDLNKLSQSQLIQLKNLSLTIVLSMLEEQNAASAACAQQLHSALDLVAIHTNMSMAHYFYQTMKDRSLADQWYRLGVNVSVVLSRLRDYTGEKYNRGRFIYPARTQAGMYIGQILAAERERKRALKKRGFLSDFMPGSVIDMVNVVVAREEDDTQMVENDGNDEDHVSGETKLDKWFKKSPPFEYFESCVRSVEILRDGVVHRVHFDPEETEALLSSVKEDLKWNVDRRSPDDKINDFMLRARDIAGGMRYVRKINDNSVARFFAYNSTTISNVLLVVTAVINLMMLFSWDANPSYSEWKPETFSNYSSALLVLGLIHVFLSVMLAVAYFISNPPKNPFSRRELTGAVNRILPEHIRLPMPEEEVNNITNPQVPQKSMFGAMPFYFLLFIALSVLGLFYKGYFYGFHLIHVVYNNDILNRVIQAVTRNGVSLLYVAMLLIVIVYLYAMASFVLLRETFLESEGQFCQNLWQCFLTSLSYGLRTGAIGAPYGFGFAYFGLRALFDVSFFVTVNIIGLNVVFGIIVDTFQELHDERNATKENMESECFICSLEAYHFDESGQGFDHHVRNEHNMWDYLYFFAHLIEKDPTEFTSHESYVFDCLKRNDNSFFPVNRALCLQTTENKAESQMAAMTSGLRYLSERLKKESEALENARNKG